MTDMSFLHDAAAALKFLKTQPKIDSNRIASFGRSWGGGIQMYMTEEWYATNAMDSELPKIRIALYPACYLTTKNPKPTPGKTFLFLGEKDNWNEAGPCVDYANRLLKEGGAITVKVYPDAVHVFDGQRSRSEANVVVWGRCQNVWDTETFEIENLLEGTRYNIKDGKWGPVWDKCVRKDWVKLQGTPQLKSVVQKDVLNVLSSEL
jgi:dienelactone hydrolase